LDSSLFSAALLLWSAHERHAGGQGQSDPSAVAPDNQKKKPNSEGTGSKASPPPAPTPVTPSAGTATSGQRTPAEKNATVVWVNSDSSVYHKPGTRWYGKTKHGKYMTEADAIKAGYKPSAKN
jgi:hypothetical protein